MTVLGVDVSHWQDGINWGSAKATVKFAIAKATEATNYFDDTYKANKTGCSSNGIAFGAYHFFRSNVDPIQQAQNFYNWAGNDVKVLVADVETNDGGDIRNNLKSFLTRLEQLSGQVPWIYTAYYFWRDAIGAQSWASRCPLWVASCGVNQPLIPPGWSTWQIWQYSSSGKVPGISGSCDMDYFNGTEAQMRAAFGGSIPPPPLPTPLPSKVRVTAAVLNIRQTPGGVLVGYCPQGTIFGVTGQANDNTGKKWWQVGSCYVASWYCENV